MLPFAGQGVVGARGEEVLGWKGSLVCFDLGCTMDECGRWQLRVQFVKDDINRPGE